MINWEAFFVPFCLTEKVKLFIRTPLHNPRLIVQPKAPLCVSMAWMCVCVWRNQSTKIEYAFPLDLLITTRRRSPTASCAYLLPQLQTGKPGHKHAWIRVWYFFCWIYYLVYGCQKLDKYLLAFHAGVSFAIPLSFEKWKLGSCN